MAEVVNLRRARKAKQRAAGEATAATNRALHGRTKVERAVEETTRQQHARMLDGAKREV